MAAPSWIRDELAGLRAQIAGHREAARLLRLDVRRARAARDTVRALKLGCSVGDRIAAVRAAQRRMSELRAEAGR